MDQGPSGLIRTTAELAQPVGAMPLPQTQQEQAPPPPDWMQAQMAEQAALEAAPREAAEQRAAEQARLEELQGEYGVVGTAGTKFVEGALNALLGSGALFGAAAESAGELLEINALRDFGRDVGEAARGSAAIQALGGLAEAAASGAYEGAGTYDAIGTVLKEQEEARPLLSTISKLAGMGAMAVGAGLGAAGQSGRLALITANAAEGAGGGAQVAYENSAPLRDVLTSAAVGGVLGGAIAGAGELAQAGAKKLPDLAKVFGEKVQDFADNRIIKAAIDRDKKGWDRVMGMSPERKARFADRLRGADFIGKGDEAALEAVELATAKANDELATLAQHLDEAQVPTNMAGMDSAISDQVAKLRGGGTRSGEVAARKIEREIMPFRRKLEVPGNEDLQAVATEGLENARYLRSGMREESLGKVRAEFDAGQPIRPVDVTLSPGDNGLEVILQDGRHRMAVAKERGLTELPARVSVMDAEGNIIRETVGTVPIGPGKVAPSYRNPSFSELRTLKQSVADAVDWSPLNADPLNQQMKRLWGTINGSMLDAADNAGPAVRAAWKQANETASDFIETSRALKSQVAREMRNRAVSPTDYMTGITAAITTAVMGGNPIGALAMGLGGALAHGVIRRGGSAVASSLANRFARMSTHVSLAKAGGAEAQEVLQALAKTKAFVSETAERAGANPTLRQGAETAAKQIAAEQLAKKAGPFDPAAWASKPLNPLQKVLYRSQILDAVSTDLSRAATEVAQMHPAIPDVLDLRRLAKMTRDADGPEAIGSLQRLTAESAGASPATPTGDAGGVVLRRLGMALDRTDPAQSIAKAHEAAAWFRQAQASAPDELSQQYAARTEQAIRAELSQPHWGQAGTEYAKMAAPPHAVLADAADPAKVRELLRTGAHLGATARAAMSQLADAFTAAAKLTGTRTPGLAKPTRALEQLFDAAEAALTLDGKPIASIFEAAKGVGVHSGAAQTINETTLAEHVESGLGKIEPLLHGNAPRIAASAATEVASREQYDKRMKVLTRTVAQPDALTRHDMYAGIATQVGGALAQLLQDMPKPSPSIHGKVFETLSQDDLRLANAMWEATTEPLSVLSDLADGTLDPDKAAYAWKQYPALQKATQAGVIDVLMGLPEEKRSELPDTVVTQLDTALGFNGALQDANEPGFAQRMSALYMPAPAKGQPNGMLDTPAAEPTFTERLSGAM